MFLQQAIRSAQPNECRASGVELARLAPGLVRACRPVRDGRLHRARALAFAVMRAFALAAILAFVLVSLFATAAHAQSDATLSELTLNKAGSGTTFALSPTFSSDTESYTATVPYGTTQLLLQATPTDSNATVAYPRDYAYFTIAAGIMKTVEVTVTSANNMVTKTYSITVTRLARLKGKFKELPDSHDGCGFRFI